MKEKKVAYFLCDMMSEIVVLSDGRVTTCCHDELGSNSYAHIYRESFEEVRKKFIKARSDLITNPGLFPRCTECYRQACKMKRGDSIVRFPPNSPTIEVESYLKDSEILSWNFVFEPTAKCNLKCIGCIQSKTDLHKYRKRMFLDLDYLRSWIGEHLVNTGVIRFYNYGEPFLHKNAIQFCTAIKKSSPSTLITVATNGMALRSHDDRVRLIRSGIENLVFSIHGGSQKTCEIYMTRAFQFDRVMEILTDLAAIRKALGRESPELIWKYILFEWNDSDEEIRNAKELAREIGIDTVLFQLTTAPSPSKRFTADSEDWKILTKDMIFHGNIDSAFWKAKPLQSILQELHPMHRNTEETPADRYVSVGKDLAINIPYVEYNGSKYSVILKHYPNPADPSGLYWKLHSYVAK
jgi:wyosine [tRNA(Phe)-imidazoG37] synthetase (radical SAM superfamily)